MGIESGMDFEAIAMAEAEKKQREAVRSEVRELVVEQLKSPDAAKLIDGIAGQGHEDWRDGFIATQAEKLMKTEGLSPEEALAKAKEVKRLKELKSGDEQWKEANQDKVEHDVVTNKDYVNINRKYVEIPPSAQIESAASAKVAIALVRDAVGKGLDVNNPAVFSELASKLHEAWLDRNEGWLQDARQKVPYEKLLEQYEDPVEGKKIVESDDVWLQRAIDAMGLKK